MVILCSKFNHCSRYLSQEIYSCSSFPFSLNTQTSIEWFQRVQHWLEILFLLQIRTCERLFESASPRLLLNTVSHCHPLETKNKLMDGFALLSCGNCLDSATASVCLCGCSCDSQWEDWRPPALLPFFFWLPLETMSLTELGIPGFGWPGWILSLEDLPAPVDPPLE